MLKISLTFQVNLDLSVRETYSRQPTIQFMKTVILQQIAV